MHFLSCNKKKKTLISDVNIKLGFAITPFTRWFPGNVGKHSTWRVFKHGRSSRLTSPHAESSHGDIVSTATAVTREEPEPGRRTGKLLPETESAADVRRNPSCSRLVGGVDRMAGCASLSVHETRVRLSSCGYYSPHFLAVCGLG